MNLRFDFLYNYDISFLSTEPHSTVCHWRSSRTQTRPCSTIAPHQSSSYPEYLSPTWDEQTQRAVVWTRLREHCKLAHRSLSKINERYKALHQEQQTQVESRHESLSRDRGGRDGCRSSMKQKNKMWGFPRYQSTVCHSLLAERNPKTTKDVH